MVLVLGVLDSLTYALHGLGRMASQPEIPCEANADKNMVIETEIDFIGPR